MNLAAGISVGSLVVSLAAVLVAWDANRRSDRRETSARRDAERARREERDRAERRTAYAAFIASARGLMFEAISSRTDPAIAAGLPSPAEVQRALWDSSGPIRLIAPKVVDEAVSAAITSVLLYYVDIGNGQKSELPAPEIAEAELVMRADLRGE